jgi:integrase
MKTKEFSYRRYGTGHILERVARWPEAAKYHEFCEIRGFSDSTMMSSLISVSCFLNYHNRPLERIAPDDVREWMCWERSSYINTGTFAKRLTGVKAFLEYAGRKDLAETIPKVKVRDELKGYALTQEDMDRILSVCGELEANFVKMLWYTGCRVGEMLMIRKKDICFDHLGSYIVVSGKTGMRPVRLVNAEAICIARKLSFSVEDERDFVFRTYGYGWAYRIFHKANQKYGKDYHPHLMRHTLTTEFLKRYSETVVKKHMGWSPRSNMPARYDHITPGKDMDLLLMAKAQTRPAFESWAL